MKLTPPFMVLAALTAGCGTSGPDVEPPDVEPTCDATPPTRSPLRRLTHEELDHTLATLLQLEDPGARATLPPEKVGGFSNNADVRSVGTATAEGYDALAEALAHGVAEDPERLLGCDPAAGGEPCVAAWLPGFVERAFRRPQPPERVDRLLTLWREADAEWGPTDALDVTLQVILQSPEFLYRVEPTALAAPPGQVVPLDGYEVASRLSYFLWATMPDETLLAAAASGDLDDAAGVEAHARRMLADPRAERTVGRFFDEWMELAHLDEVVKDPELYPDFTDDIRERYVDEVRSFVGEVWDHEAASFEVLMTAPWTMADPELAAFYDLPEPSGPGFSRVERDPAYHAGFLTQGAFLASRARPYESSPVHRGMFVRGNLLCEPMNPPVGLDITPPDPDPNLTTRERLAEHRADPACAGCHDKLDPPGFALEHFDAVGRFRTTENGRPIDATGELVQTDVNGPFDGANELAWMLADSHFVHTCFGRQWYRYAHGRGDDLRGDACAVEAAVDSFRDRDLDIRELIIATTTTEAFRSAIGAEEGT